MDSYNTTHTITKNIVQLHNENRITSEVMTMFEYTYVISTRAKQIESGSMIFVDTGNITDYVAIAKMEIEQRKCPLDIVRKLSDTIIEKWHVNEMVVPKN